MASSLRVPRGVRRLIDEWNRNYRIRSGAKGLISGFAGSVRLSLGRPRPTAGQGLDVVSFSVVPGLTRFWLHGLLAAIPEESCRVLIGDCSGALQSSAPRDKRLRILQLYNHVHGVKLDLFMSRQCQAPFVMICDDDIFWLSKRPLTWALDELAARPEVAVVSLYPRGAPKPVLAGKVEQPMGSFCLVIRRDIWMREKLSFRSHDTTGKGDYDWTYDTADLAHQQLVERGYEVVIAPPEVRADLASLEGVSTWALKLQKYDGDMSALLRTDLRLRKAYRVFRFLADLQPQLSPANAGHPPVVPAEMLQRSIAWCKDQLPGEDIAAVDREVGDLLSRLRDRLGAATEQTHA